MKRLICMLAPVVGLTLIACVWMRRTEDHRPPQRRSPGALVAAVGEIPPGVAPAPVDRTSPVNGPLRFRYEPGQRLAYRVEEARFAENRLEVPAGDATAPRASQVEIATAGTWILTVLARDEQAATLLARLEDASVSVTTNGRPVDPSATAEAAASLSADVLARVSHRGVVEQVWYPRSMPAQSRAMARSLLLGLHARLSEGDDESWVAEEEDATGTFVAEYHLEPTSYAQGGTALRKVTREKRGYRSLAAASDQARAWKGEHHSEGTSDIWIAPAPGRVTEVRSRESFQYRDGGATLSANGSSWYHLDQVTLVPLAELPSPDALTQAMDQEGASGPASDATLRPRRNRCGPEGQERARSVTSLAMDMQRMDQAGQSCSSEACAALDSLAELFGREEGAVQEALDLVRSGLYSQAVRSQLLCALGTAGTPACQRALVAALEDPTMSPASRQSALVGVTAVQSPGGETEIAVRRFSEGTQVPDLSRNAVLVLGAMAWQLRDADSGRADRIQSYLEERYARAGAAEDRVAILEAFGNAGGATADRLASASASDRDDRVRGAAMTALRRVSTASAEEVLIGALREDRSPAVRLRAIDALSGRGTSVAVAALRQAAEADPLEEVREVAKQAAAR